jgi:hypothetical protein
MPSYRAIAVIAFARMVSGQAAPAATDAASVAAAAAAKVVAANASALNQDFHDYIFIILAALIVGFGLWRIVLESVKYVRHMTCLNNETQRYFAAPSRTFATFKKHLLYAPILKKRHNQEMQLSAAINVGTLPTRFQLLFLTAYLATNVAFCIAGIDLSMSYATVCQQLRNRTGILAVVNMVRSSTLITWTSVLIKADPSVHHGSSKQPSDQLAQSVF